MYECVMQAKKVHIIFFLQFSRLMTGKEREKKEGARV